MSITPSRPYSPTPPPGLPPVAPPTTRFVVQLFLVPALIVLLLVLVAYGYHLFFGMLFGSPNPDKFLSKLDDANAEVRWRTAADLSQVLLRDDRLATDADFALNLADRLEKAQSNNKEAEESLLRRFEQLSADDLERERRKLQGERDYIGYLSASLGNFYLPIGAPVLQKLAAQETGMEPRGLFLQRSQALWALINLGEKCKRFDKLARPEQDHILARLEDAVERRYHADWAAPTVVALRERQANRPDNMGVAATLEQCATAPQPYLRQLAAMGLNFWSGTDAENHRIETTLEKLSYDKGEGEDEQRQVVGENPDGTITVSKKPGRQVCYNATLALARRGSDKLRPEMLEEMLNEDDLRDVFRIKQKDGSEQAEEAAVIQTMLVTLETVAELKQRNPQLVKEPLREAVNKLAAHPNAAIANQAKKTQLTIN